MTESRKCKNCYYSETIKLFDPVLSVIPGEGLEEFRLNQITTHTQCHYAGKPQFVDADKDWCHQWREKEND